MFSNRLLFIKIGICTAVLIALCAYNQVRGLRLSETYFFQEKYCIENPKSCIGETLVHRVRLYQSVENRFVVEAKIGGSYDVLHRFLIEGNLETLRVGQIIDIVGDFDDQQVFHVIKYRLDNWVQQLKYLVSILGLIFSVFLLSRRYGPTPGSFLPLVRR